MTALAPMLAACTEYMTRFGLFNSEATRAELVDVLGIPDRNVENFSRYGRLGVDAA